MTKNQQIIDKLKHGGKDSLTDDDVKYIQEVLEHIEGSDIGSDYSWYADMAIVVLLVIVFVVGIGIGAWVF
jgi:hypothetical protein